MLGIRVHFSCSLAPAPSQPARLRYEGLAASGPDMGFVLLRQQTFQTAILQGRFGYQSCDPKRRKDVN